MLHPRPTHPYSVAFDANAITRVCDGSPLSLAALHVLRRRVKDRSACVVATWPLISELSGLFERKSETYRRTMSELRDLSRSRILLHWDERIPIELKQRGWLGDGRAFHSTWETEASSTLGSRTRR